MVLDMTFLVILATTLLVLAVMMVFVVSSKPEQLEDAIKATKFLYIIGYGVLFVMAVCVYMLQALKIGEPFPNLWQILAGIGLGFILAIPFAALAILARIPPANQPAAAANQPAVAANQSAVAGS
ncbi:MAG: hypothetical protein ACXWPS_22730 [Ktedonobacteraceae bacterium]